MKQTENTKLGRKINEKLCTNTHKDLKPEFTKYRVKWMRKKRSKLGKE
jgi:hypothetical protein